MPPILIVIVVIIILIIAYVSKSMRSDLLFKERRRLEAEDNFFISNSYSPIISYKII